MKKYRYRRDLRRPDPGRTSRRSPRPTPRSRSRTSGLRPRCFATGIVSSVPIRPPRLNQIVACVFQCSTERQRRGRGRGPRPSPPSAPVRWRRPWMNALQLHQVMQRHDGHQRAADRDADRMSGAKSSRMRAGRGMRRAAFQRSGSFTNMRTTKATAAGTQSEQEHVRATTVSGGSASQHGRDLVVDEGRQEQPERRGGVEQRAGLDALLLGHDLGDHRRARRPFAADAQAGDEAEHEQHANVRRERAGRRAERVEQHGQHAACACGRYGRRSCRRRCRRPPSRAAARTSAAPSSTASPAWPRRLPICEPEQRRNAVRRHVVEQQAVEDIEAPAEPGGEAAPSTGSESV